MHTKLSHHLFGMIFLCVKEMAVMLETRLLLGGELRVPGLHLGLQTDPFEGRAWILTLFLIR